IYEPKDHFGGYENTYPKGKLDLDKNGAPKLAPQKNALKELMEESGLKAEITGYLGDYKGATGSTRYYVARRTGGAPWRSGCEADKGKLGSREDGEPRRDPERDQMVRRGRRAKCGAPAGIPKSAPIKKNPKPSVAAPSPAPAPSAPAKPLTADEILHTKVGS